METLTSMGFSEDASRTALRECNGNLSNALDWLLAMNGGEKDSSCNEDSSAPSELIVQCAISQYSLANGRSACSCIALCAASILLTHFEKCSLDEEGIRNIVTADNMSHIIMEGVQVYESIIGLSQAGIEHMSPEEVLQKKPDILYNNVKMVGTVQSAILSSSSFSFSSFLQLSNFGSDSALHLRYSAIVLVKPPETIVVFIPPHSRGETPKLPFILVDSHPRPPLCEGSYAKFFRTLDSLSDSLTDIFPKLDLGPQDEMMNVMYNSIDAYMFH